MGNLQGADGSKETVPWTRGSQQIPLERVELNQIDPEARRNKGPDDCGELPW